MNFRTQNYPSGWLTAALTAINQKAQIRAFCWFVDSFLYDAQWDDFSLTNAQGNMAAAAEEFDLLLQGK